MSLDTVLNVQFGATAPQPMPDRERRALVLMGGGARTAYQVGVLRLSLIHISDRAEAGCVIHRKG